MPDLTILLPILIVAIYLLSSIKILAEYERGVIFRLGRVLPHPKGPGVILVFAPIDRISPHLAANRSHGSAAPGRRDPRQRHRQS